MVVPKRPTSSHDQPMLCGTSAVVAPAASATDTRVHMRRRRHRGHTACNISRSGAGQFVLAAVLALLFAAIVVMSVFLVVVRPTIVGRPLRSSSNLPSVLSARSHQVPSNDEVYDIIILGRGPAGLSAALFAARSGLSVLVLGSDAGALSQAVTFDNFPSWQNEDTASRPGRSSASTFHDESSIGGPGWLAVTRRQADEAGATFAPPGLLATDLGVVHRIDSSFDLFSIHIPNSATAYKARSVILATGSSPRKLDLPNEAALCGKSLHSCALCDGSQYVDKVVMVVGGGDTAIDAALILSRRSTKVYLVHRRDEWKANDVVNIQAVERADNVQALTPYVVKEWVAGGNDRKLTSVLLAQVGSSQVRNIQVDGAFVMIGSVPNTKWLQTASSIALSGDGRVLVGDNLMSSSHSGIFAAGEIVDEKYRQAIVAASDGAKAAIEAERWLRSAAPIASGHVAAVVDSGTGIRFSTPLERGDTKSSDINRLTRHTDDWSEDLHDANPEDCDLTNVECIEAVVKRHPVVVFSKPWCPHCRRAIEALGLDGVTKPHIVDLSQLAEAQMIQSTLEETTGRRTVPNVFVGGKSIGGGDETTYMQRSGKLKPLLEAAGALS